MKDRESRFMGANKLQLEKMGLASESDVIGKSDFDFFPSYMTAHYHADDQRVMETKKPIRHKVELVANPDGSVSWHITSKFPLLNKNGKCIGLAGIMRDLDKSTGAWKPQQQMAEAMEHINQHYDETIEVADLARLAGLSISQFDRRFRAAFGQTPSRFLIQFRLTKASQQLVKTNDTISHIAHAVGFYDHSHFSREFQKTFGLSPGQYRKEHSYSEG